MSIYNIDKMNKSFLFLTRTYKTVCATLSRFIDQCLLYIPYILYINIYGIMENGQYMYLLCFITPKPIYSKMG